MTYHPAYVRMLTKLLMKASVARARAEVVDTYDAVKYLRMSEVYLELIYHLAPSQVGSYVNERLQAVMGDDMTVSKYFEHLGKICDDIQMMDMRARDKQELCNREYAAALDVLFMVVGDALNRAGVFRLSAVEESRVKRRGRVRA